MFKWIRSLLFLIAATPFAVATLTAAEETPPELTIAEVMQKAHKQPMLLKTVAMGDATDEQKKELLSLYQSLAKAEPPLGDLDSWKEKTELLVKAAQAAVDGKENAGSMLEKSSNCAACHDAHKPEAE